MTAVLDSSAVLAALWGEPGGEQVEAVIGEARISAVHLSELAAKLVDRGATDAEAAEVVASLGCVVVPFDQAQAMAAARLRRSTRAMGLSLADRCCLALAQELGVPVLTADRAWAGLDLGVDIQVVR